MADAFVGSCAELLSGVYDCVDRVVLNAYFRMGYSGGGFRTWWRQLHGGRDDNLTDASLMRMVGRFSRRVRAWGKRTGVPVLDCAAGQDRKHDIAERYLREHPPTGPGVFLVLVARAWAPVWQARRGGAGGLRLVKKLALVNHYSFHIWDAVWGHITIKMSGHPPFGAQIILNGHEYVARAAQAGGVGLTMDGNCFTAVADPRALAELADTLSQDAAIGRLSQVCDRWIYTACLCFGLDLDQQASTTFEYSYSVYQVEYSRNLLFRLGGQMQQLFDRVVDRARTRLDIPVLNTIFGTTQRPYRTRRNPDPVALATQIPRYGLTLFRVNYGALGLKAYTKAERLLRLEAVAHNVKKLPGRRCGLDRFPDIVAQLAATLDRFATALDCVDTTFLPDTTLDQLPQPGQLGATRLGGIDLNKPRARAALHAALALSTAPNGFTVADLTAQVNRHTGGEDYTTRQAAYDLKKMRAKHLVDKPAHSRRYRVPALAARTIAALLTLREHVLAPLLAGVRRPGPGRPPTHRTSIDRAYQCLREHMLTLLQLLGIHLSPPAAA